ncbi:MAG: PIN domain-containing protein [Burkholderiaceae bacterium]|nr:PIN domain-containing protein [Burkholderiaceae bacterium]
MNVLVDTPVWSIALRRPQGAISLEEQLHEQELRGLIREDRVVLVGAVRQELLSGIRREAQFAMLRDRLAVFADLELRREDYEFAAECFNRCRARGIRGSNTDFLLCAVALRRELPIYTVDRDFNAFRRALPLALHEPG